MIPRLRAPLLGALVAAIQPQLSGVVEVLRLPGDRPGAELVNVRAAASSADGGVIVAARGVVTAFDSLGQSRWTFRLRPGETATGVHLVGDTLAVLIQGQDWRLDFLRSADGIELGGIAFGRSPIETARLLGHRDRSWVILFAREFELTTKGVAAVRYPEQAVAFVDSTGTIRPIVTHRDSAPRLLHPDGRLIGAIRAPFAPRHHLLMDADGAVLLVDGGNGQVVEAVNRVARKPIPLSPVDSLLGPTRREALDRWAAAQAPAWTDSIVARARLLDDGRSVPVIGAVFRAAGATLLARADRGRGHYEVVQGDGSRTPLRVGGDDAVLAFDGRFLLVSRPRSGVMDVIRYEIARPRPAPPP